MDIITHELLRSWRPCKEGYRRFCELFPCGADLQSAIDGLVADGHDDWAYWLFDGCRQANIAKEIVALGYRNSGNQNSGNQNSGNRNSGHWNSGETGTAATLTRYLRAKFWYSTLCAMWLFGTPHTSRIFYISTLRNGWTKKI